MSTHWHRRKASSGGTGDGGVASRGSHRVRIWSFILAILAAGLLIPVAPSAAAGPHLVFNVQPSGGGGFADTVAGKPITPAVEVWLVNGSGTLMTNADDTVTISIESGPAGAKVYGNVAGAVGGVASFPELRVDLPGAFTLRASASKFDPAISDSFDVTGSAAKCQGSKCPKLSDPAGGATSANPTSWSVEWPACDTTGTTFVYADESSEPLTECDGNLCLSNTVFFDSSCVAVEGTVLRYTLILDKTAVPLDQGAVHPDVYINVNEGDPAVLVPPCKKPGVLDPAPFCVSSQNKTKGGDIVAVVLKVPGDPYTRWN